ncbi:hypothetical protein BJ508DRAFT_314264 [Ascobolus immersus RN42]|uniref:Uncharacterized protein n=1 Tax=Ascobolus immersus RN42 TaxID=1160509 RepID=A0A3N4HK48_ASCIM|nr:hypothetical protein BJ508DRAFT_314264 [Ascobolus immersus RN42]
MRLFSTLALAVAIAGCNARALPSTPNSPSKDLVESATTSNDNSDNPATLQSRPESINTASDASQNTSKYAASLTTDSDDLVLDTSVTAPKPTGDSLTTDSGSNSESPTTKKKKHCQFHILPCPNIPPHYCDEDDADPNEPKRDHWQQMMYAQNQRRLDWEPIENCFRLVDKPGRKKSGGDASGDSGNKRLERRVWME